MNINIIEALLLVGIISNIPYVLIVMVSLWRSPRLASAIYRNMWTLCWFMRVLMVSLTLICFLFPFSLTLLTLGEGRKYYRNHTKFEELGTNFSPHMTKHWSISMHVMSLRYLSKRGTCTPLESHSVQVLMETGKSEGTVQGCKHCDDVDLDLRWWAYCDECLEEAIGLLTY